MKSLNEWLAWIRDINATEIIFGLERVNAVVKLLDIKQPKHAVVMVAGTNGKGSCVRTLEAIYQAAGYRVGIFTSPIIWRHNEEVRVNGLEAADEAFCQAFNTIEEKRANIQLTPFEYHAIAALWILQQHHLDIWILEVGMGGRLDAVNTIDADAMIVSSIDLDHTDWLGDTREAIAYEKAGIFRRNMPAICGDLQPPKTLIDYAAKLAAPLYRLGIDFGLNEREQDWCYWSKTRELRDLPYPSLTLSNVATALMTIETINAKAPIDWSIIPKILPTLSLPGRIQIIPGNVTHVCDVSHNPAGTKLLAKKLRELVQNQKVIAVFSMLSDKNILETLKTMRDSVKEWYVAPMQYPRAASLERLQADFLQADIHSVIWCENLSDAYAKAKKNANDGDWIIAFGSFHVVAEVLPLIKGL